MELKQKIFKLLEHLNKGLIEKEDIMKIGLLTLLSSENIVLLGLPGTAKSEVSRRLSQVIEDGNYFEYLLTKFTTPEELFGPLSITKLKNDQFERNVEGYMPSASVVFLDEVFKANSSILNSLLTIINEKKYHNGRGKVDVPLISLVGASNEFPTSIELEALYDRFLVKKEVGYIESDERKRLLNLKKEEFFIPEELKITREEIEIIKIKSKEVLISDKMSSLILKVIEEYEKSFTKDEKKEIISDRKIVKISKLLKISAFVNERNVVDISDLTLLRECLWNNPKNITKVDTILDKVIKKEWKEVLDIIKIGKEMNNVFSGNPSQDIKNYQSKKLIQNIGEKIGKKLISSINNPETLDEKTIKNSVNKANQNDIQPEKIQLEVQKKNEVIEKIEELCQENIWL